MCSFIASGDKEITMINDRRDGGGYMGWFLFGAMLGAGVALLMTPKTGAQARELLAERGGGVARRAQEFANEAQGRAGEWLDKSREFFEEQTQRLMSAFEAGRDAMREEIRRGSSESRG
jgi:gas vesicle protein